MINTLSKEKQQEHDDIAQQIEDFLRQGKKIEVLEEVPKTVANVKKHISYGKFNQSGL